jgi:hypothetical protein
MLAHHIQDLGRTMRLHERADIQKAEHEIFGPVNEDIAQQFTRELATSKAALDRAAVRPARGIAPVISRAGLKRAAWWLLALLATPFVVWMSDETCEELLRRATLGTPVDGLLGGVDDDEADADDRGR